MTEPTGRMAQRVSDAERERVVEQLRVAAGDGRLRLDELDQRIDAAYAARTYVELDPLTADLPGTSALAPRDVVELHQTGSTIRRTGAWVVPRRLVVHQKHGSARLDFSAALIEHAEIEIALDRAHGSTRIVVPPGAAVNVDELRMKFGSIKNTTTAVPAPGGLFVRVTGQQNHGSVRIRYPRPRRAKIWQRLRLMWRRS